MKSARIAGLSLVLAFVVAAPLVATAQTLRRAVLTGQDALAPSGVPARVRFKAERDTYSRYDLSGVAVEFWANGSKLGTATSGYSGWAELQVNVPGGQGDLVVTGKLAANSGYSAPDETLLLAIR